MKAVSGKHFCKVIEKHGWVLKRTTKGSHFIYTKPGNPETLSAVPLVASQTTMVRSSDPRFFVPATSCPLGEKAK
jgi:predicted RNA binding protein YcfA (HicA-like mRNA interferase family)